MKISFPKILVITVIIAVVFRLVFFLFALNRLPVSSDEAWPGLMGLHILKGEFPVVYWGQSYMGTQEAFCDALLIALFGANAFSIRIYPLVFGGLFLYASYRLASRIYSREVGLLTLLLLAVPMPYLTICSVVIPPNSNLAVVTLGSFALLLAHAIVFEDQRHWSRFLGLGCLLGFAFWMHMLIASYLVVILAFLWLKDKWLVARPKFWLLLVGFAIGSAPLIGYNIVHAGATFSDVASQVDWAGTLQHARYFLHYTLPYLFGAKVMLYGDTPRHIPLPATLSLAMGAVWLGTLALVLVLRWRHLWRLAYLSLKNVDGTALLLALTLVAAAAYCRSARSYPHDVRYILPLLSALPILLAYGLWRIYQWRKAAAGALLAVVLTAQVWGNATLAQAWCDPRIVAVDLELPDTRPLIAFLKAQGIRHAYAHFWLSYRLTFETREQLICAEPYNMRFPHSDHEVKFLNDVGRAASVAFICHPTLKRFQAEPFEELLKGIGGTWRTQTLGCFTVFYDFHPPFDETRALEIPRAGWKVASNYEPQVCPLAIDGDPATVWTSGAAQRPGMVFKVDLGRLTTFGKIRFDLGGDITDYPRGYTVDVSRDQIRWEQVFAYGNVGGGIFWENGQPRFLVRGSFFNCLCQPVEARFLRISQTGADPRYWWTIAELHCFGPPAL